MVGLVDNSHGFADQARIIDLDTRDMPLLGAQDNLFEEKKRSSFVLHYEREKLLARLQTSTKGRVESLVIRAGEVGAP